MKVQVSLTAARVNAGYTQDEAAKKVGITKRTLMNWESGKSFPSVDKAYMLCELYNASFDDIIFVPKNHT